MNCTGIITAMVTPLDQEEQIDHDKTKQLIDHLINKQVHGLFILGTNGEGHALNRDTKCTFTKLVMTHVNSRVPVYVGVGENSTKETVIMAKQAEQLGADALSVITPYFMPPTQTELIHHYTTVAQAVQIPIVLYNMPSKTGVNIEPETVKVLTEINNIIAIKDSSGDLDNMGKYLEATKKCTDFHVLSGSDANILKLLQMGGAGAVSATSNLLTDAVLNIFQYWHKADLEKASHYQASIEPLRTLLKRGTVPSVLKATLNASGLPVGQTCKPVLMPNDAVLNAIENMLEYYRDHAIL
ncbi:4-hydroxy-tetrahydrodipicolinate synthase [Amphibacillus jilinensis]|uniref:4-hydroxy-tetrahydrodipicolinate synthase n=1 Tax=Amphibacillus jilinensis TaxID=1216008 RepID=UPI0002E7BA83|nr:4-hydroxy-tetrahydrodipicolinate synthase [Amphibacillus jilinensis]